MFKIPSPNQQVSKVSEFHGSQKFPNFADLLIWGINLEYIYICNMYIYIYIYLGTIYLYINMFGLFPNLGMFWKFQDSPTYPKARFGSTENAPPRRGQLPSSSHPLTRVPGPTVLTCVPGGVKSVGWNGCI